MGRAKKERIDGVVINRYDGDESTSVAGGASTVTTAPGTMPTKNPKDILVSTPVNPQTGETAGSGTPSAPSAEVPSEDPAGGSGTVSGEGSGSGETGSGEPSKTYGDYVTEGYEGQKGIINSNYKSYEQFWNGYLANAESSNAKEREAAEQRAETERQRGVIDGQASYDFNKATYGKQAEALRSMGLSGSGYADYLTSRAYATQRAEVQGANAQAATAKREAREAEARANATAKEAANKGIFDAKVARDSALADAKTSYLEGMLQFEQNKDVTFTTLLNAAESAMYGTEALTSMARKAGLSEEQIAQITGAYTTAKGKKDSSEKTAAYASLLDLAKKGGYTPDELTKLAEAQGLDESQITDITTAATTAINEKNSEKDESAQDDKNTAYIELLGLAAEGKLSDDLLKEIATSKGLGETEIAKILEINNSADKKFEEFKLAIENGMASPTEIKLAFDNEEITPEEYEELRKDYSKGVYNELWRFKHEDGTDMTYEEGGDILTKLRDDPLMTPEMYNKLAELFNEKYVHGGQEETDSSTIPVIPTAQDPAAAAGQIIGEYLARLLGI